MKKIEAVIRPHQLDLLVEALTHGTSDGKFGAEIQGMTVSEVKGFGRQKGQGLLYGGPEYRVEFHPKYKIEIVVRTDAVAYIVETIERSIRTGRIGDGKIWVLDVEMVVRIRTGEIGGDAV